MKRTVVRRGPAGNGIGKGQGIPGGMMRNINRAPCPLGGPGFGQGGGQGMGRGRRGW